LSFLSILPARFTELYTSIFGMAGIDISDKNAWDDSFLQDSWNAAVAEYEVEPPLTSMFH
jgi:hypothetical protein